MKIICSGVLELVGYFKNKQTNQPPNKKKNPNKTRQTLSDSTVDTSGFNFALISRRCDICVLRGVNRGKGMFPAFLKHKTFFQVLCAVSRKQHIKYKIAYTENKSLLSSHTTKVQHVMRRFIVMSTHFFGGFLLMTK